ncbi:Arylsulfatase A [Chryseolinea serpens]|uniref:Arylsulfatase A n=1 Tax=Chryseolinea serpens TaxID=947013 RepID=A0A1M5SHY4_9BACT|nr:sulfatase [Chryseolinea serpens]SHH37503.1 Arylsulfatase A [Chryseolinea serpens]
MTATQSPPRWKKILRIFLAIAVPLAVVFSIVLRPYASHDWDIVFDEKGIEQKKQFLSAPVVRDTAERPPNIIILVADDLGKTDIPLYGPTPVKTPYLDSLAATGVKFTEGYVTASICSPSRAGLLTGRYQQRFGHETQPVNRYIHNYLERSLANTFIDRQQLEFADLTKTPTAESIAKQGLPLQEITLADLLKHNGYATGIIGKWHLGAAESFQPLNRGFDYHYGFYEAFSWYADTTDHDFVNVRNRGIMDSHVWEFGREGDALIRRNNEILDEKEYLTYKIAGEAINFIDQKKDKPFFLYVPFNAPHTPFQAPKNDVAKLEAQGIDRRKAVYYAMIEDLDNAIGAILKKVKASGLEENTLIYFISDNGGATYTGATDNAPLKGGKMSLYEGGINVPFIVRWKGHLPAGKVYDKPVSSLDIFTTSAAAAHAELPPGREYDGVNLVPYLTQTDSVVPHETLFWRAGANKAVRKGDWKLVINRYDNITALYNLATDKSERNNVAGANPAKVKELESALADWEKKLVHPLWPSNGFFVNEFDGQEDRFTL